MFALALLGQYVRPLKEKKLNITVVTVTQTSSKQGSWSKNTNSVTVQNSNLQFFVRKCVPIASVVTYNTIRPHVLIS